MQPVNPNTVTDRHPKPRIPRTLSRIRPDLFAFGPDNDARRATWLLAVVRIPALHCELLGPRVLVDFKLVIAYQDDRSALSRKRVHVVVVSRPLGSAGELASLLRDDTILEAPGQIQRPARVPHQVAVARRRVNPRSRRQMVPATAPPVIPRKLRRLNCGTRRSLDVVI